MKHTQKSTKAVDDSPASLPGRHKWVTRDQDVRKIEKLLGMPHETIGAPLWVSGNRKSCPKCQRQTNWLDIVSSALGPVHAGEMIARMILGAQKYVNTEAPRAIRTQPNSASEKKQLHEQSCE